MLKNYITVAIRNFKRHKLFSFINILCLSIGITFSMIIAVYVLNQQRVNKSLSNIENQYFLKSIYKQKDLGLEIVSISALAKAAKENYPSLIKNYFRYNPVTNVVSAGDKHFKEDIAIGDTTLVSMYGFPLLYGDKNKAFANNSSAIITESFAAKLFGTKNAVGKTLTIQTTVAGVTQDYMVSAVLKDIPYNSVTNLISGKYSVYIPTTGSRFFSVQDPSLSWDNTNEISFLELMPGVNPKTVEPLLNSLLKKNSADFVWKNLSAAMVPVGDYYLNDNNGAVRKMIMVLSIIAVFILLMVIINFVNINIGTSSYRLKEIGLRKTFGGARKQIIFQFVTESLILSMIAAVISIVLYQLCRPVFSQVLNAELLSFWRFGLAEFGLLLSFAVLIGVLAGLYPAFVLSSKNLLHAVKGKIDSSTGGLVLKRGLLIVQFSLAIVVFICTLNLSKQVSFIFQKDLGYSKDQLLVITAFPKQWDSAGVARMESIKQGLLQLPEVKNASLVFDLPESTPFGRIVLYPLKNAGDKNNQLNLPVAAADEDYAKTFGIKMMAGSFFANSKNGIVINETAAKQLGLTSQNAVGRIIETGAAGAPITVAGVMKDFNFSSLQEKIGAIGYVHINSGNAYRYLVVKLNTENISGSINDIKSKWKSFVPSAPFEYTFMDDKFASLYKAELQLRTAANIATILNVIIVLLGIVGVVAFMLNKRNKEIAVRKVLGADAGNIIFLFLKEYAVLIVLANIIAWPLAYMVTENLLQNFAYRINQDVFPYLLVLVFISVIAFGLIALQCFKVAVANPVKSLRTE
ncbi:ABC transporter permease [Foetidibacter luteolus]|uniref:ABC transporter permease n=1 Tax=Foetidibacter luteolus TaxID=2608880 RepID=UPI00129B5F77|nr:ABC transporter permease [Foetidibacter luteolus]